MAKVESVFQKFAHRTLNCLETVSVSKCAIGFQSQEKASSFHKAVVHGPQLQLLHPILGSVRFASTTTVVPPVITKAIEAASPVGSSATQWSTLDSVIESIGPIPEAPGLPGPKVLEILAVRHQDFFSFIKYATLAS